MMDYRYIEQLLQRYFDCETTLQEEAILRSFFSQEDIPARLTKYRDLFTAEALLAAEAPGTGFEARVMERVEGTMVQPKRITLMQRLMPIYKAAAGVAVILTLGFAAQRGIVTHDDTVTTHPAQPAGEQVSVLPQDAPSAMQDTMLVAPQ